MFSERIRFLREAKANLVAEACHEGSSVELPLVADREYLRHRAELNDAEREINQGVAKVLKEKFPDRNPDGPEELVEQYLTRNLG